MDDVRIVDTTLRDGQQSLWACRMRLEAMLPALPDLDAAGFDAMEFIVPSAQFPRAVRDLQEDPWDWIRLGSQRVSKTELRLHGSAVSRFTRVPESVQKLFLDRVADLGITTTRTSDAWNDYAVLGKTVGLLTTHNIRTVVNLIYSVSPRHTLEYYAQKTREAASLNPYRICFKDVGGLLTPESAREVFPVVVGNAGDVPLEFHGHCANGFGPYVSLLAAESGIRVIHAAIPPLADGNSLPSVFSLVNNLRARGTEVSLDATPLQRVSAHFYRVASIEGLPEGSPELYDERLYSHQIPGGMIANLTFQLCQIGMENRLEATIVEVAKVREEFGYPIMVTPLAQFVGSQAALNIITGQRYATVTDEVIEYALGRWGVEAVSAMDPGVRERILDRPRAKQLEEQNSDEPSLEEVRQRFGGDVSDEELLVRVMAGEGSGDLRLRPSPNPNMTYEDYEQSHRPMAELMRRASASRDLKSFDYRSGDISISLSKN